MDKTWKVVLAFIGIFVAGTVTGILIAPRLFKKVVEHRSNQTTVRTPMMAPQFGPQLFRRVTEQLELTSEQSGKLKGIEARTTEELRRLRRQAQHDTEGLIKRMQDEIASELTPAQRVKFDELVAKARERMQKFMQEQEQRTRGRREGQSGLPRDGAPRENPPRDGELPK